jgi:hypothetical protein
MNNGARPMGMPMANPQAKIAALLSEKAKQGQLAPNATGLPPIPNIQANPLSSAGLSTRNPMQQEARVDKKLDTNSFKFPRLVGMLGRK